MTCSSLSEIVTSLHMVILEGTLVFDRVSFTVAFIEPHVVQEWQLIDSDNTHDVPYFQYSD